jgi:hypothetical protein
MLCEGIMHIIELWISTRYVHHLSRKQVNTREAAAQKRALLHALREDDSG